MTTKPKLVLASHNPHKLEELTSILEHLLGQSLEPGSIVTAGELGLTDPVEDGTSFAENALIKARHVHAATGLPAFADDSGLIVDILGAAPGIFSARWSGGDYAANNALLLHQLSDVLDANRGAYFITATALVSDQSEQTFEGRVTGRITRAPRGTSGFGYDPIFLPDLTPGRTFAELTPAEKSAISHRANAIAASLDALKPLLLPSFRA